MSVDDFTVASTDMKLWIVNQSKNNKNYEKFLSEIQREITSTSDYLELEGSPENRFANVIENEVFWGRFRGNETKVDGITFKEAPYFHVIPTLNLFIL